MEKDSMRTLREYSANTSFLVTRFPYMVIFENFKGNMYHSQKCALKITGIKFGLLENVNMMLDYENLIRRGITRAIRH